MFDDAGNLDLELEYKKANNCFGAFTLNDIDGRAKDDFKQDNCTREEYMQIPRTDIERMLRPKLI